MQNLKAIVFQRHQKIFGFLFGFSYDSETQRTLTGRKHAVFNTEKLIKKLS